MGGLRIGATVPRTLPPSHTIQCPDLVFQIISYTQAVSQHIIGMDLPNQRVDIKNKLI